MAYKWPMIAMSLYWTSKMSFYFAGEWVKIVNCIRMRHL